MELALVPGRDYPYTYRGFVEMFPDDTACAAFLARLRWPEGFILSGMQDSLYSMERKPWTSGVSNLSSSNIRECGNDL